MLREGHARRIEVLADIFDEVSPPLLGAGCKGTCISQWIVLMKPLIVALNAVQPAVLMVRACRQGADVNDLISFADALRSILGPLSHNFEGGSGTHYEMESCLI